MKQEQVRLHISGMNCQACASRIEKVLNRNVAVRKVSVNYASEDARITYDNQQIDVDSLINIIKKTGFQAHKINKNILVNNLNTEDGTPSWRLITIWLLVIPFLVGILDMFTKQHQLMLPHPIQLILSAIAQLFLTTPIYRSAIASIKGGLANMDVLVALGTTAIFLFSLFMYLTSNDVDNYIYFESNVMIIAFISLGKYIERRAKHNGLNSLNNLLSLFPRQALVFKQQEWVPTLYEDIVLGNLVKSNTGEKICADGTIKSGFAWIDESHLTGESLPVKKNIEDSVLAGSIVTDGSIIYQVSSLGTHTQLGDMINALHESQATKAPIARIADKIANIFVPTIVVLAIMTFITTYLVTSDLSQALIHSISVLIIACPCALGLATPAAIMVGMGIGTKHGIWFKNAETIETTASINSIVFDKTGTFTEGKPSISQVWLNNSNTTTILEDELLKIAASIEQNSFHPLAQCIVNEAKNRNFKLIEPSDITSVAGSGIQGRILDVGLVKVGSPAFCQLELPSYLDPIWNISSIVAVSVNHTPIGAFALSDSLKSDAKQAMDILRKHTNIPAYIMSGDKQSVVSYIADLVGISQKNALGALSPRDKAAKIEELLKNNQKVAMVGDGINDAPALATATIGIAMGNGADIANQTANIVLIRHSIRNALNALYIGQKIVHNIKQNLFFAFIYNVIGIPLAAFGFLTPVIAGLAMSLSSISVILNALRLKYTKLL